MERKELKLNVILVYTDTVLLTSMGLQQQERFCSLHTMLLAFTCPLQVQKTTFRIKCVREVRWEKSLSDYFVSFQVSVVQSAKGNLTYTKYIYGLFHKQLQSILLCFLAVDMQNAQKAHSSRSCPPLCAAPTAHGMGPAGLGSCGCREKKKEARPVPVCLGCPGEGKKGENLLFYMKHCFVGPFFHVFL